LSCVSAEAQNLRERGPTDRQALDDGHIGRADEHLGEGIKIWVWVPRLEAAEQAVARLVGALRLHEAALHTRPFSAALAVNLAELAVAHDVAGKPKDADKARHRHPLVRWFSRPIVRWPSGLTIARAAAGQDPRPAHPGRGRRRRHRRPQARA
jgi:hypothetical protein